MDRHDNLSLAFFDLDREKKEDGAVLVLGITSMTEKDKASGRKVVRE